MTPPSLRDLFIVFGRIGFLSFGGPAAQIALMHKELVDDRPWLTEAQYLNALSFCMLLPGPEAMQLATYSGWRIRGVLGGLIAGLLFVLPGAFVILGLSWVYALYGQVPLVEAFFLGIKATVLIIVLQALLKVARKALHGIDHWCIAGLSFVAIYSLALPFPLIIVAAATYGFVTSRGQHDGPSVPISTGHLLPTVSLWLALWLGPLLIIWLTAPGFLTDLAFFFSKLAVVTFGGAYAVLAYMTQEVVSGFGWLTTPQMIDGLGLAETTPGPLILVTEFVGFVAGYQEGGSALAVLAATVTLWMTFAPCFLWIFAGAPYIEWIATQPRLKGALTAITAAVVGVVLNLSIWFALHVFFADLIETPLGVMPVLSSLHLVALALSVVAGGLLLIARQPLPLVLACLALLSGGVSFL
jgi:chromate transporter